MEKLKVAMVGVGRATAYGHIFAVNPRTQVVALCDMDSENLEKGGKDFELSDSQLFSDYDKLLEQDLDIVVLGTPIPFHAEQTVKALDKGIHVLSEVTAASSIEECVKIYEAVRRSKAKYMMAENCVYMDFAIEWKKWIRAGKIGRPFYAEADYIHEIRHLVSNKWRSNRAPLHYCSHSLGPILDWMDDYVVRATALGTKSSIPDMNTIGAIDLQVALFETAKGAAIKVARSSVALREPALCTYSIIGEKGFLEGSRVGYEGAGRRYFDGVDNKEHGKVISVNISDDDAPESALLGGHGTSEYYLVLDFLKAIDNNETPYIDVVKAMDMTIPGLVAHDAAMKGGVWMDVPRIDTL